MSTPAPEYVVHGVRPSYFTRKITGYLDYKRLGWWLSPDAGAIPAARAAGWNGGIPAIRTPEGEMIWDSTAVILHLDRVHADRPVSPPDPTIRFLDFVLEDFADEWLYRHAVGSRWMFEENRTVASWEIARDASYVSTVPAELAARMSEPPPPPSIGAVHDFVSEAMTGSLPRLGVSAENIDGWMSDSLRGWQRVLDAHLRVSPYLFGRRPSLADFALFGGNMAHFINDPYCRRLTEENGPEIVAHTQALATSREREFGDWAPPGEISETLIALLAETGRQYLPWVAQATRRGSATVSFADGSTAEIATTPFLSEARGVLLARYLDARSDELDAVLDDAGILTFFADHVEEATAVPDPLPLPQAMDNRPFPAGP